MVYLRAEAQGKTGGYPDGLDNRELDQREHGKVTCYPPHRLLSLIPRKHVGAEMSVQVTGLRLDHWPPFSL